MQKFFILYNPISCNNIPLFSFFSRVAEIALNIDFLPTFLDIAHAKPPKYVDGTSVMDIAVGGVINRRKR